MRNLALGLVGIALVSFVGCGSEDDTGDGTSTGGTAGMGGATGGTGGATGGTAGTTGGTAGTTGGTAGASGGAAGATGGAAGATGGTAGNSSGGTGGAAGAGGSATGGTGGSGCGLTGTNRPFGACCTDNAQCTSNLCFAFGDGTKACTQTCTADAECPAGSQGKKCNNQGVCRP